MELAYALLDTVPQAIVLYNPVRNEDGVLFDFTTRYYNRQALAITTFSDQDMQSKTLFHRHPPSRKYIDLFVKLLDQGESLSFEHYAPHLDKWYLAHFQPFEGGMLCRYEDITEMKRQFFRARALDEELTNLAHLNQTIIDAATSGLILFEAIRDEHQQVVDFRYVQLNKIMEVFTGLPLEWIKGNTLQTVFSPEVVASLFDRLKQVVATGEKQRYQKHLKLTGVDRWVDVVLTRQGDGVLFSCNDVTALKEQQLEAQQAYLQLAELVDELNRSNEQLRHFASVASHDLQEPLRKVASFAELLLEQSGDKLDTVGLSLVQRIMGASSRMSTLVRDLLIYSRLNTDPQGNDQVDLNEVVREVLMDLEIAINEKKAIVKVDNLPALKGHRLHFRQLFQNLITNALKFNKPDQPPVVKVRSKVRKRLTAGADPEAADLDKSLVEVCVEDNGIGFEMKDREKIFQMFGRLQTKKQYPGSGIGLAICKRIVENYGGEIEVESKPGEGTNFCVILPGSELQSV